MTKRQMQIGVLMWASAVAFVGSAHAMDSRRIRFDNARIEETFRFALERSPAFEDLVATLQQQDRIIYIEEGSCQHQQVRGCLQPMPTPGGKHLLIRIDTRQSINLVVAQLAHELYHASEIAREPDATDLTAIRALYRRIGEQSCHNESDDCWETRAARTFETLVTSELNRQTRPQS